MPTPMPSVDQNGAYAPNPGNPFAGGAPAPDLLFSPITSGSGDPTHTPLVDQVYLDTTGLVEWHYDPVNGWTPFAAAAGGKGTVTTLASDPTGVLVITGKGVCFGTGAVAGQVWYKSSTGTGSDWTQL